MNPLRLTRLCGGTYENVRVSNDEEYSGEDETMTIPRWEMKLTFPPISKLIGESLEHLQQGNHIEHRSRVRH